MRKRAPDGSFFHACHTGRKEIFLFDLRTGEPQGGSYDYISELLKGIDGSSPKSAFEVIQMDGQYDLVKYIDRLYSAAVKKAGDTFVAEDIVQETLLAAVSQLSRGKEPDNLWAWLLRILSNKYCDWLREKYNRPQISFEDYPFDIADERVSDDGTEEMLEAVRRELGYLAQIHREVMVRFYLHGHSLERIAKELEIPVGTVKSRLNIGRKNVREGVNEMENYTRQSYEPDVLRISCAGEEGFHQEPFSLLDSSDRLSQSILILAYPKPLTETEIARALGVPVAFVEPVVERLVGGELMCRTDGGRVYTDFILYTDGDRKATFKSQLALVEENFLLFWRETEKGLSELREKTYYERQTEHARNKMELYFCVKALIGAYVDVRNEVTGEMPFSEYPYRRDGGRWIAMGMQYPPDYSFEKDRDFWKYSINGEAGFSERNFRDAKWVELREYGTSLGKLPGYDKTSQYVKWFYELSEKVSDGESAVNAHVLQDADSLIASGFLKRGASLELDLPVLNRGEYWEVCGLAEKCGTAVAADVREALLPVFEKGYVKLPAHLRSVPKWQQYMFCGDSVPMAVIHRAIEKGLLLKEVEYPVPAALLVYEKID